MQNVENLNQEIEKFKQSEIALKQQIAMLARVLISPFLPQNPGDIGEQRRREAANHRSETEQNIAPMNLKPEG